MSAWTSTQTWTFFVLVDGFGVEDTEEIDVQAKSREEAFSKAYAEADDLYGPNYSIRLAE